MESIQKFDFCEELSDEDLATISGGVGFDSSAATGTLSTNLEDGNLSVQTSGIPGSASLDAGNGNVTLSGQGLADNEFTLTL